MVFHRAAMNNKVREINYELNRQETIAQRETLISYPPLIQIPTGSRCNLRCSFCTDRDPSNGNDYKHLSLEEFIPLTDGLPYASTVQLNGWGEPFFNPDYERIFDYVTNNFEGITVYISTNGTLLRPRWQEKLLEYGNFSLNVSINAATRRTYHSVTGEDLFDQVITNLRSFMDRREERGAGLRGYLSISFVVHRDNFVEMPDFVDLAVALKADHVHFMDLMYLTERSYDLSVADLEDETRRYFSEAIQRASRHGISIGSFLTYSANAYLSTKKGENEITEATDDKGCVGYDNNLCYAPWRDFLTCSDGTVTVCCRATSVMGNVRQEGFDAVWNGPRYQYFRATVNSDTPPDDCRQCPVRTGLSNT